LDTLLTDDVLLPIPFWSRDRLIFFVVGIVLAGSIVLRQIASAYESVQFDSPLAASHERRLRRTLNHPHITWAQSHAPALRQMLGWQQAKRLRILIDESGHTDQLRVLVAALWYRNRAIPLAWDLIMEYRRRSAIETLFRDWKTAGWQWEASQVRDLEHQERLLVALAWATLLVLVLGEEVVQDVLRPPSARSSRSWVAKHSLFRLGKDPARARLAGTVTQPIDWFLAAFDAPGWQESCRQHHALAGTTIREG
jgi:hypothetical protein